MVKRYSVGGVLWWDALQEINKLTAEVERLRKALPADSEEGAVDRWGLYKLKVGECIITSKDNLRKLDSHARRYGRKYAKKFSLQTVGGELKCWRIK